MKRIPYIALLACGLLLAGQQQASAWTKFNFGVGLNTGFEGGGNSVLWGALKGAQSPGHTDGAYPGFGGGGYGGYGFGGMGGAYADNAIDPGSQRAAPFAQGAPMGMPTSMPQAMPMPQTRQMPRADAEPVGYFYPTYPAYPQYLWYYGNGYGY